MSIASDGGLKAPKGKFRVVGYDSFDHDDFMVGDYDTEAEARKIAHERGGTMTLMHVYDDQGKHLLQTGTW